MCKANSELLQYPGSCSGLEQIDKVEFTGNIPSLKKSPRRNAAKSHCMSVKWDSLNDELKCFSSVAKLNK